MALSRIEKSYAAFKGEPAGDDEGGIYDVEADRLVIFDAGPGRGAGRTERPCRLNTFTLVHEATHQLTFDTGLLSTRGRRSGAR